jgi:hypothetical protein
MVDVVPGDDAWAWLAGTVEDCDLLVGEPSRCKGRRCQPFFWESPEAARTCPTSLALTG